MAWVIAIHVLVWGTLLYCYGRQVQLRAELQRMLPNLAQAEQERRRLDQELQERHQRLLQALQQLRPAQACAISPGIQRMLGGIALEEGALRELADVLAAWGLGRAAAVVLESSRTLGQPQGPLN